MTTFTRPTGAIASVLDETALLDAARAALATERPDAAPELLGSGPTPQMLMAVDHGVPAVINREGVGALAENDAVDVYFEYALTWMPIRLNLEAVAHAATDETIDLAEGIRTFGDRLDSNHAGWHRRYDTDHRPCEVDSAVDEEPALTELDCQAERRTDTYDADWYGADL